MDICPGSIVFSKAGRDKGKYFVVLNADDAYAYICDGGLRKVTLPKKKKLKHLKSLEYIDEFISNRLNGAGKVTNREVRRCIHKYVFGTEPDESGAREE